PQGQSDLAAGWTGQELAEGHQIGVTALGQPAAADDKLVTEVAKVRHGPAKGGQAQTQEDQKDGPGTVAGCRIDRGNGWLHGAALGSIRGVTTSGRRVP